MPTAKPNPITPSRRTAILGSLGLAAAAVASIPAQAAASDTVLLAACDRFSRVDERILRFDTGALDVTEDDLARLWPPHFALIDQITSIAAATPDERIAKAKAALAVMRYAEDVECQAYDNLVRSALRDVIAGGAA